MCLVRHFNKLTTPEGVTRDRQQWGRDAPVSARVVGDRSTRVLATRSVERPDGFDYGGSTLVERVGDRIGVLVPRAYSLPVLFPALHQRLGFGRYRRRHRRAKIPDGFDVHPASAGVATHLVVIVMAVIDNLLHRAESHKHLERGITRREIVFAVLHAPRRVAKTRQRYDETDDGDRIVAQLGFYRS
jgi:hypothetical protein